MQKKNTELGKDLSFLTLFLAKTPISGLAVVRACTEKRSELQGKNIGPKKSDPRRLKVIFNFGTGLHTMSFSLLKIGRAQRII
jgi:hypothetical protein